MMYCPEAKESTADQGERVSLDIRLRPCNTNTCTQANSPHPNVYYDGLICPGRCIVWLAPERKNM